MKRYNEPFLSELIVNGTLSIVAKNNTFKENEFFNEIPPPDVDMSDTSSEDMAQPEIFFPIDEMEEYIDEDDERLNTNQELK